MLETVIKHKKSLSIILLGLVISQSFAQYEIKRYSINSGGQTNSGGDYQISGSVGQVDASNQLTGGNYSLNGGFWHPNNASTDDLIFKNGFE